MFVYLLTKVLGQFRFSPITNAGPQFFPSRGGGGGGGDEMVGGFYFHEEHSRLFMSSNPKLPLVCAYMAHNTLEASCTCTNVLITVKH